MRTFVLCEFGFASDFEIRISVFGLYRVKAERWRCMGARRRRTASHPPLFSPLPLRRLRQALRAERGAEMRLGHLGQILHAVFDEEFLGGGIDG